MFYVAFIVCVQDCTITCSAPVYMYY